MRTENSLKNVTMVVIGQTLFLLLNFISRRLFLLFLSIEYLGISGLFSSIITILSLAELGVGTAITYSLYKPLAEKQNEVVKEIMHLFEKIYKIVGIGIILIGIAITPLVMKTIRIQTEITNLQYIYILFVVNSGISYFFSYSRTLIVADQKEYKLSIIDNCSKIAIFFLQTIVLLLTKNYLLYLIVQVMLTLLQNYLIYRKVNFYYSYLKDKKKYKLAVEVRREIKKNTLAMIIYKAAIVSVAGTDNIIISVYFGTTMVGMYSNYYLFLSSIQTIVSKMIGTVTASIGNVIAIEDKEKTYLLLDKMQFICFWLYGFCSIAFIILLSPFVGTLFGKEYILSPITVLIIVLNFYLLGMQGATSVFRDAFGIFYQGRMRPLVQGVLNIVISIFLVYIIADISAVFLGTIISRLLTITWFEPYLVHKFGFKSLKNLFEFWKKYFKYFMITLLSALVSLLIANIVKETTLISLLYKIGVCALIPNICFYIMTCKTKEFIEIKKQINKILIKMRMSN